MVSAPGEHGAAGLSPQRDGVQGAPHSPSPPTREDPGWPVTAELALPGHDSRGVPVVSHGGKRGSNPCPCWGHGDSSPAGRNSVPVSLTADATTSPRDGQRAASGKRSVGLEGGASGRRVRPAARGGGSGSTIRCPAPRAAGPLGRPLVRVGVRQLGGDARHLSGGVRSAARRSRHPPVWCLPPASPQPRTSVWWYVAGNRPCCSCVHGISFPSATQQCHLPVRRPPRAAAGSREPRDGCG